MGMKGIVFSLDAIIALIVGISILTLIPLRFESLHREYSYSQLGDVANDLINILANLEVKNFKEKPTIEQLREIGFLKEEDLEKSLLDLIGSLWFGGNESLARNVSEEILANLTKGYCINLTAEEEAIYSSCLASKGDVATRAKITSGYEVGKPVFGYVARAWARKIGARTVEKVFDFNPLGSGWGGQPFTTIKKFSLPPNITVKNGLLYLSMHYGKGVGSGIQNIRVNGVEKKNEFIWLFEDVILDQWARFGYVNITKELREGWNEIYVRINSPTTTYHAHFHPGGRVEVSYESNQTEFSFEKRVNQTIYFDKVEATGTGWSGAGAWQILPFFLPPGSSEWNVTLTLKANSVEDKPPQYVEGAWHQDAEIYLNGNKVLVDAHPPPNPLYVLTNSTLAPHLKEGTNVFSVFLNAYADEAWGASPVEIYSDSQNDSLGSSRIELSYLYEKPARLGYLQIDLTKLKEYGPPNASNPRETNISFELKPVEAFNHLVEGFSAMVELKANNNEFFRSSLVREVPTTTFIPPEYLKEGNNTFYARDFQPNGATSPFKAILRWSTVEYTMLVPAAVSYGNVFNTSEAAIADAKQRLLNLLSAFNITVSEEDIVIDSSGISGIRWLWGPSLFKLVVWKK